MSFTRFNYDNTRTVKRNQEMTGPCRYILNTPGPGADVGFSVDPHVRLQKWGTNLRKSPVDIASELDGRNRVLEKYGLPYKTKEVATTNVMYNDNNNHITDETRATHPVWMYRDLPHVRWEYPVHNPQYQTCTPFSNNISSRIQQKNSFIVNNSV